MVLIVRFDFLDRIHAIWIEQHFLGDAVLPVRETLVLSAAGVETGIPNDAVAAAWSTESYDATVPLFDELIAHAPLLRT